MMRSTALETKWWESGLVECRWQIEFRHKRLYKSRPDARRLLAPREVHILGPNGEHLSDAVSTLIERAGVAAADKRRWTEPPLRGGMRAVGECKVQTR